MARLYYVIPTVCNNATENVKIIKDKGTPNENEVVIEPNNPKEVKLTMLSSDGSPLADVHFTAFDAAQSKVQFLIDNSLEPVSITPAISEPENNDLVITAPGKCKGKPPLLHKLKYTW